MSATAIEKGSFTDQRDGKTYKTVKIGSQIWMAENLNYEAEGSVCYDNNPKNGEKYGRLYDWETAMKVCPEGWHLPSVEELEILLDTIDEYSEEGIHLKAKSGWNEKPKSLDTYGFSALPSGHCGGNPIIFDGIGKSYGSWLSDEEGKLASYHFLEAYWDCSYPGKLAKFFKLSVRCIKNYENRDMFTKKAATSIEKDSFTDPRDGKTYKTVKIGSQIWMAENLNYEAEGSVCYDNDPANAEKYGRLYDWHTAVKSCPKGWHLPTGREWEELFKSVTGSRLADNRLTAGKHLKAKTGWNDYEGKSGNGLDTYGFSALPGGESVDFSIFTIDGLEHIEEGDYFDCVGISGFWWTADEKSDSREAWFEWMLDNHDLVYSRCVSKYCRYSVRCVKDKQNKSIFMKS
jgi:uncharacterized protein (TIGR02145 family)